MSTTVRRRSKANPSSPAKHLLMRYYRSVLCPICKKSMKKVRWDISYNHPDAKNKEYDRTLYQCLADDVWITAEIPKSKSNE